MTEKDTIWLAGEIVKVYDAARGGVPMTDQQAQEQARKWHEAFELARTGGYADDLAGDLVVKLGTQL